METHGTLLTNIQGDKFEKFDLNIGKSWSVLRLAKTEKTAHCRGHATISSKRLITMILSHENLTYGMVYSSAEYMLSKY